ncbi:MAG TPA: hypothetical protein VGB87_07105, partial [Vicinamibacteria bacterium]
MPTTLKDFATAELDRARKRREFAQEDLQAANAAVNAAKDDQANAAQDLAAAERAAREIRAKLAQIPMPADGAALLEELEGKIVEGRAQEARALAAEARISAGRARADRAAKDEARASAAVALAEDRKKKAEARHLEYANTDTTTEPRKPKGWKPKATTDLAGLPQDADDLLNDATKNQDYAAAKARVEADVPAALLTRARDRGQKELDALAAARQAVKAKEDERATELAASGGKAGAVVEKEVAFARAEAALRDFVLRAEEERQQAVAAFKSIAASPALTQAVKDRIAALTAAGAAALPAEQDRDTARLAVEAKQALLDARIEAVRDGGGDVTTDAQVATLQGDLATANGALAAKQAAFDAVKADLDAWEAAVPETTWTALFALDEAKRTLDRLKVVVPATLVSDFDTAEDAYATRLGQAAEAARKATDLEDDLAVRAARAEALLDAKRRRVISALR